MNPTTVAQARRQPTPAGVQFLLGEIGAVEGSVRGHFGAALCLGNTLPYLLSAESASRMLVGLKRRLLPGAPVVVHTLNYDRVFAEQDRALPLEFLPCVPGSPVPDGELVVVRVVEPQDGGMVLLTTSALRYRPTAVPAMELVDTRTAQLRGWTSEELRVMLEVSRVLVYQFAWKLSQGQASRHDAAILKLYSGEAYKDISDLGLQIFGGYGYCMEYPMQRFFRDSRLAVIGGGTSEIQRNIIAKSLGL